MNPPNNNNKHRNHCNNPQCCGHECGVCCYYGGGWTALPLVLATIAMVCSWGFTFSCHFWSAKTSSDGYPYDYGLWDFEYFDQVDVDLYRINGTKRSNKVNEDDCVDLTDHPYLDYSDYSNGPFRLARSMSILVCVLGFFMVDFLYCIACCECNQAVLRYFMVQQFIFGIMTLLVLVSRFLKRVTSLLDNFNGLILIIPHNSRLVRRNFATNLAPWLVPVWFVSSRRFCGS